MTGKRIGLVIGNNYPNSNKELKYSVADAEKIKEILGNEDICGFDEVILLLDGTSKDASKAVEKLLRKADEDLVFIYYSGHGKKDFEGNLCLLFNDTEEDSLLTTSLSFDFIIKCTKYPSRKSVIIVLDCCYSGVAGIRDADTDVMEALKKNIGSGTVIITSTGSIGSPTAREDEKLGHGIFTYYFIEGLVKGCADQNCDGLISIDELYDYAYKKTTENCTQSPKREGRIEGNIPIGKNSKKIKENELELKLKTDRLLKFVNRLPPRIFDESLTILRKNYDNPSSMGKNDIEIYRLLESFLEGELSVDNYSITLKHLKEISINVPTYSTKDLNSISRLEAPSIGNIGIFEMSGKYDTSKNFTSHLSEKTEDSHSLKKFRNTEITKTYTNSMGMEFVLIPAGEFMMGSQKNEGTTFHLLKSMAKNFALGEFPSHKITIKNSFYLGKYPVSQKQWIAVMNNNPSSFKGEDRPVECVSCNDIQIFIKKINEMENTDKYRLPSEAEWEYACRAGTGTGYFFGDNESELNKYAWYVQNSDSETHPVGQKKPNPWGLYDMYGNVSECVQDKWHDNYIGAPSDGSAWEGIIGKCSLSQVCRGGCWENNAGGCRSASRTYIFHGIRSNCLGFRLGREL